MNVILNKECILIIHKFELIIYLLYVLYDCVFRIKSDSSSAEFARYGVLFFPGPVFH